MFSNHEERIAGWHGNRNNVSLQSSEAKHRAQPCTVQEPLPHEAKRVETVKSGVLHLSAVRQASLCIRSTRPTF
jgi:hypothetical protein